MSENSFLSSIIDKLICEIKKKENMNKLEKNLIDPLINYTFKKLYPYLALASVIFLLIFIIALLILLLQVKQIN